MHRLYQKSEIWFAVAWIIVYVVGASAADGLSASLGLEKSVTLVFLAALSIAALAWLKRHALFAEYGLCSPTAPASAFLYYIPLLVLASCNLWRGITLNLSVAETLLYIGSMLLVGFLEELIFRGFLFRAMSRNDLKSAIVVSSVTFGIGHIVNLVNGSGAELLPTICQIVSAIAFGFLFVILFHRGGSLLPCILTHSCLNALSAFADESGLTPLSRIFTSALLTIIAAGYTLILLRTLPTKTSADVLEK